jgi:hypothetical protein
MFDGRNTEGGAKSGTRQEAYDLQKFCAKGIFIQWLGDNRV